MLITRHCVMLVCAGEGCGLPVPDEGGEAVHFDGLADPRIKRDLDGCQWTTRGDGSRLCYGCRCKELGRPADGEMDNPLEGEIVHFQQPCGLVSCDCCGDLLGGDQGLPHFASTNEARAALADDPGWPAWMGWPVEGDSHYCGTCVRRGRASITTPVAEVKGSGRGAGMSEQFDPTRHRVFAVDVVCSYRTYVVAESADAAESLAGLHESDDRAMAVLDREVSELDGPVPDAEAGMLPWGPIAWGRRELTVGEALELVRRPQPAPVPPATDELQYLGDWDWVRLAAGIDASRPALGVVRREGDRAVATDGHRLHVADAAGPAGLWDAETGEPYAGHGEYPDVDELLAGIVPALELIDLAGAWEVLRAARPGPVAIGHGGGRVVVAGGYLAEALIGAVRPDGTASRILVTAGLPAVTPVGLEFPDIGRTALLMPMRGIAAERDLNAHLRWLYGEAVG